MRKECSNGSQYAYTRFHHHYKSVRVRTAETLQQLEGVGTTVLRVRGFVVVSLSLFFFHSSPAFRHCPTWILEGWEEGWAMHTSGEKGSARNSFSLSSVSLPHPRAAANGEVRGGGGGGGTLHFDERKMCGCSVTSITVFHGLVCLPQSRLLL